jgi:hypothetical protein
MFKTLKGKVNGLLVLCLIFAGGVVTFGNIDAGENIQLWYNRMFDQAASTFNDDYKKYLGDKIAELENDKINLNSESQDKISGTKTVALSTAKTNIGNETDVRIDSLVSKKNEISDYMSKQFDSLLDAARNQINTTSSESLTSTYDSLKTETQEQGKTSLTGLEQELAVTADEAISELETEIENAKASLQQQLDNESYTTTLEVKKIIDAKIAEIRALIIAKNTELTQMQQSLITQRAQDLEESVKEQLDSAISGM